MLLCCYTGSPTSSGSCLPGKTDTWPPSVRCVRVVRVHVLVVPNVDRYAHVVHKNLDADWECIGIITITISLLFYLIYLKPTSDVKINSFGGQVNNVCAWPWQFIHYKINILLIILYTSNANEHRKIFYFI